MKKFLALVMAMILAFSVSVIAFANGGFIASPSGNDAPEIVEIEYDDDSCEPEIVVTPYSERDDLDEKRKSDMEKAYDEIAANKDLTKLCPALRAAAIAKGADPKNLGISDLFDVTAYHKRNDHKYCGSITLTLSAETLKNFVALIHRNPDTGKWEYIADAYVDETESTITFKCRDFSPFAIVVDKQPDSIPETGGELPLQIIIPAAVVVVSAISLGAVLIVLKKKKQEA